MGRPRTTSRKCGREPAQRLPALPRPLFGVAADEPHEHRHERQREQHDQRRFEIDVRHPGHHGQRDHRGEHHLWEVAGEVGLERVDALHGRRGDLAALDAVRCEWLAPEPPAQHVEPQLGEHVPRGAPAGHLHRPREHPAGGKRECEQRDLPAERGQRGTVKRPRDDARQQRGLEQHRHDGGQAERPIEHQQRPRGPRPLQQARVEGAHGPQPADESPARRAARASSGVPAGRPPTRARKTW